jgi:hypothetical protein
LHPLPCVRTSSLVKAGCSRLSSWADTIDGPGLSAPLARHVTLTRSYERTRRDSKNTAAAASYTTPSYQSQLSVQILREPNLAPCITSPAHAVPVWMLHFFFFFLAMFPSNESCSITILGRIKETEVGTYSNTITTNTKNKHISNTDFFLVTSGKMTAPMVY